MTFNTQNKISDVPSLEDVCTPEKATLLVWWAIVWRFSTMLLLFLFCVFFISVLLHSMLAVPIDIVLLFVLISTVVGSTVISYFAVQAIMGRPLNNSILVSLPLNTYMTLLPNKRYLTCKLEKWHQPYRMAMHLIGSTTYTALQTSSISPLYVIIDNMGLEVARCSPLSLLGQKANRFVITRSNGEEPSVTFLRPGTPNKIVFSIGETEEIVNYTRAKQKLDLLGAALDFKWNRIDIWFERDSNKLSDPLFAAIVFFIFLERSQAGGW